VTFCPFCDLPIIWAWCPDGRVPLDALPRPQGGWLLYTPDQGPPIGSRAEPYTVDSPPGTKHTSHVDTCVEYTWGRV
jgi:hypothetical protein